MVPDVYNFSCWTDTFQHPQSPGAGDIVKVIVSLLAAVAVIVVNCIFILAVNSRRHARHMSCLPRYLLTSLSLGELLKGLVAAPLSVYPSLYHCWPYPRPLCGVQALLLPILHQHTATTLSLLAMDQYWCILHPGAYRDSVGTVRSVLLVLLSWVVNLAWFAALFLPTPHFYFSHNHSYACELHQSVHPKVIITACVLYFPTTMVTMYAYGTVFHHARSSLHTLVCSSIAAPQILGIGKEKVAEARDRQQTLKCGRVLAILAMFFIILITPYTLRHIIVGCTNYTVPGPLDYAVWLLGELTGVLLVSLLWLMSPVLRAATRDTVYNRICCGNVLVRDPEDLCPMAAPPGGRTLPLRPLPRPSPHLCGKAGANACPLLGSDDVCRRPLRAPSSDDGSSSADVPTPPLPPVARLGGLGPAHPPHLTNGRLPGLARSVGPLVRAPHTGSCDLEAASEKYWGEILERAVSSSSLHNLRLHRADTAPERCTVHTNSTPRFQS